MRFFGVWHGEDTPLSRSAHPQLSTITRIWSYVDSGKTTSPEPGTEYDVLVYGELGTLVHTESGVTGTTWTYLEATEIAESGLARLNDHLRVVIRTSGAGRTHEAIREVEWELDRV